MTKETELKAYKFEKQQIINRLDRIYEFANTFTSDKDISLLEVRQGVALSTFKEFNQVQSCIEERLVAADLGDEANNRNEFEDKYFTTLAKINSIIKNHSNHTQAQAIASSLGQISIPQSPAEKRNKISLPVIKLPEFSGVYTEWLSFRDIYVSVIHENTNLSNVEKFHYLRSTLKGEALRAIESYSVSNLNYDTAWKTLQKRYQNERLIVHSHVRNIINIQTITKSNYDLLRRLIDDVTTNIESLKTLNIPINEWDAILVPIITDKLDYATTKEWQPKLTETLPTLAELLEFLEMRCKHLKSMSQDTVLSTQFSKQKSQAPNQFKPYNRSAVNHAASNSKSVLCTLCSKNNHFIHKCTQFLNLPIANRIEQVKKLKLCDNCLRSNHGTNECRSNITCRQCQAKHNSLLHLEPTPVPTTNNLCSYKVTTLCEVLLSTAIIYILDNRGQFHECRALLDSGSQSSFITKDLCQRLNLKTRSIQHKFTGINMSVGNVSESVEINLKSKFTKYNKKLNCLVLTRVTENLPLVSFSPEDLEIPKNIHLADDKFYESSKIELSLEANLMEIKVNRLSRLQLIEKMRQHFWQRWQREYISELQTKRKWKVTGQHTPKPKVGDLVLLVEDGVAPLHWPLGRIEEIYPGKDGSVRVVTVRTNKGVYKRGFAKIAVLPVELQ